ncbi:TDT family transporter [Psychromonas ossibalaenae]|uniref:TDT family transporter n=1 Tax=Psychromonas ossibalaenae TaxID=444922 RepID=UPI00036387DA|nr:TDT family transporter [Psychromonas ossibalaenae]
MLKKVNTSLSNTPTALAGLALGIASLGWCWENQADLYGKGQMFGALVGGALLILLLLKFIVNPGLLKQDLSHHMSGSVVPTFAMATMIVAKNIGRFDHSLAQALWLTAIVLHLIFLSVFIYYRCKNFTVEHILPSWFIPPVGIVVAAVSFPGGVFVSLAQTLFVFGLAAYAVLLPVMLYRLFFTTTIADNEKPTIAIFAAPASLLLAGYLTIAENPHHLLVVILGGLAVLMTFFIYFAFTKLLRLPFSPAYSAFTFPLVIGATAMYKTAAYLSASQFDPQLAVMAGRLADIELLIATLMVAYVCLRYLVHFSAARGRLICR